MSDYTDSVEATLRDLKHVSVGVCGGCVECAESVGFERRGDYLDDTEEALEDYLKRFEEAVGRGAIDTVTEFSRHECGICGSHFAGSREVWHWTDANGYLMHESDACFDCVIYLANGDEPAASHAAQRADAIARGDQ